MKENKDNMQKLIIVSLFAILMIFSLTQVSWATEMPTPMSMSDLGNAIFDDFAITSVFISLVLVAAMLGGVFLAKERRESK